MAVKKTNKQKGSKKPKSFKNRTVAPKSHAKQVAEQKAHIIKAIETLSHKKNHSPKEFIRTGIPGFDELFSHGIPKGSTVLLCGGPGSGKTIFGLQTLNYGASKGEKCLYMTFEESESRLKEHMEGFGWNPDELIRKGKLVIKRYDPFEVTRQVEAMLEKAKGELRIDVKPVLFPKGFKPDRVVVDSLSAIASAFIGKEDTYRIYIEQLFRLLEEMGATSFLISESTNVPVKLTKSGVEEFLADGVIILYNLQKDNVRENAVEVLKIRGEKFRKRIVAMEITESGITVYPEQEVFRNVT